MDNVFVTCFSLGPPVIIIPPKNTSLNVSQKALLRCQAVANPPNMTYVWQKGGENVYHIEWVWSLLFVPERAGPLFSLMFYVERMSRWRAILHFVAFIFLKF